MLFMTQIDSVARWLDSSLSSITFWIAPRGPFLAYGSSLNDVHKNFGFFDILPPCPHLDLIYALKFTQPPFLRPHFHDPPPMRTSHLKTSLWIMDPVFSASRKMQVSLGGSRAVEWNALNMQCCLQRPRFSRKRPSKRPVLATLHNIFLLWGNRAIFEKGEIS